MLNVPLILSTFPTLNVLKYQGTGKNYVYKCMHCVYVNIKNYCKLNAYDPDRLSDPIFDISWIRIIKPSLQ